MLIMVCGPDKNSEYKSMPGIIGEKGDAYTVCGRIITPMLRNVKP